MDIRCNYTVYCHINKVNGKTYVGITSSAPELRWKNGEGYKNCRKFYNAILKYGWDNFYHIILRDKLSLSEAEKLEKQLITDSKEFSYNIAPGGKVNKGFHWTEQSKRKLSLSKKSKPSKIEITEEYINKLRTGHSKHKVYQFSLTGKLINIFQSAQEAGRVLGISSSEIYFSCYNYKGVVQAKGFIFLRYNNPEELNRRVILIKDRFSPIGQFNNTELIRTFSSTKEAEQATGVKASYIRRCLRGERNLAGGFVWKKIEY